MSVYFGQLTNLVHYINIDSFWQLPMVKYLGLRSSRLSNIKYGDPGDFTAIEINQVEGLTLRYSGVHLYWGKVFYRFQEYTRQIRIRRVHCKINIKTIKISCITNRQISYRWRGQVLRESLPSIGISSMGIPIIQCQNEIGWYGASSSNR